MSQSARTKEAAGSYSEIRFYIKSIRALTPSVQKAIGPLYLLAPLAVVVWAWIWAVYPCVPAEGDEQGVMNGVIAIARQLPDKFVIAHDYPIQPGTYAILLALQHVIPTSLINIYGWITFFGAFSFYIGSAVLLAKISKASLLWVLLLFAGLQEIIAAGLYANSTAIAGTFPILAILLVLHSRRPASLFLCSLLIALGAWIRMDSLLLAPTILPALVYAGQTWTRAAKTAAVIAISALVLLAILFTLSGTSLAEAWQYFEARPRIHRWSDLITKGWLALPVSTLIFAMLAAVFLATRHRWNLLLLWAVGVLPSLAVYGPLLTTTKYEYYALPFFVLPILVCLNDNLLIKERWRVVLSAALIVAMLSEALIGIRNVDPHYRRFDPSPWFAGPIRITVAHRSLEIGLGEGEIIGTDDAFRVRSGWAFAPRVWKHEKLRATADYAQLNTYLNRRLPTIITTTYLSFQVSSGLLLERGFDCVSRQMEPLDPNSERTVWKKETENVELVWINNSPTERQIFAQYARTSPPTILVNDRGRNMAQLLGVDDQTWRPLSNGQNDLICVYEKTTSAAAIRP